MSTSIEALPARRPSRWLAEGVSDGWPRYIAGVLALAAAYYGAAKAGQALQYTASVSAIWPPAGLGIAALYLWGLRWWPGIFLGDLVVNLELLLGHNSLPAAALVGQQLGNMAEIVVGAALMRRLIGPRADLDRVEQVTGMFAALALGTAISAAAGTISMLGTGVISVSQSPTFLRTWWLGDLSGALIVVPFMVVWARAPLATLRHVFTWEGGLLLGAVATVAAVAASTSVTVVYVVFPVLIWAAWRFKAPEVTLAVLILAGGTVAMTAYHLGVFSRQEINSRTLGTQLYISVAAITALLLSAVVSERERSTAALIEAKRHEGEEALEERHRIARDLHDSVSQALFSTILQTRAAEKALRDGQVSPSEPLAHALAAIGELTRTAQSEMRSLIYELRRDPVENGLVAALHECADDRCEGTMLAVEVEGPIGHLPISRDDEAQLFAIGREALTNVVKHARAANASVRVDVDPDRVLLEISDDGRGFDPERRHPGHYGLESMRGRANEIGGRLSIASAPGLGTLIRVETPVAAAASDGV
jgi:signal transduction histidine kinase